MEFNRDHMRKRFQDLAAKREKILAAATPLRESRDAKIQKHTKEVETANKAIQTAEKGLYDIDQERAMIARALGHKGVGPTEDEAA